MKCPLSLPSLATVAAAMDCAARARSSSSSGGETVLERLLRCRDIVVSLSRRSMMRSCGAKPAFRQCVRGPTKGPMAHACEPLKSASSFSNDTVLEYLFALPNRRQRPLLCPSKVGDIHFMTYVPPLASFLSAVDCAGPQVRRGPLCGPPPRLSSADGDDDDDDDNDDNVLVPLSMHAGGGIALSNDSSHSAMAGNFGGTQLPLPPTDRWLPAYLQLWSSILTERNQCQRRRLIPSPSCMHEDLLRTRRKCNAAMCTMLYMHKLQRTNAVDFLSIFSSSFSQGVRPSVRPSAALFARAFNLVAGTHSHCRRRALSASSKMIERASHVAGRRGGEFIRRKHSRPSFVRCRYVVLTCHTRRRARHILRRRNERNATRT